MISASSQRHQLHHCRVQLVNLAGGGGAAFEIADVGALLADDERPLELAGVGLVDAEVGHQLDGAADALGDVGEGAVAEHRRVEGGEEVVGVGHH